MDRLISQLSYAPLEAASTILMSHKLRVRDKMQLLEVEFRLPTLRTRRTSHQEEEEITVILREVHNLISRDLLGHQALKIMAFTFLRCLLRPQNKIDKGRAIILQPRMVLAQVPQGALRRDRGQASHARAVLALELEPQEIHKRQLAQQMPTVSSISRVKEAALETIR